MQSSTIIIALVGGLSGTFQFSILVRAIRKGRRTSAIELGLLTLNSLLLVWFVLGGQLSGCTRSVLILERRFDNLDASMAESIIKQLNDRYWSLCTMIAVEDTNRNSLPTSAVGSPPWKSPQTLAVDPAMCMQAFVTARGSRSIQDAMDRALYLLENRSWNERTLDFILLRQPRIVIAHGEQQLWQNRMPIEVDTIVTRALDEGIVIEEFKATSEESIGSVVLLPNQQLPGHRPLGTLQRDLHFLFRHPQLSSHSGSGVPSLKVSGSLNNKALLIETDLGKHTVLSDGSIAFKIPVASFNSSPALGERLEPDFAALYLQVVAQIDGMSRPVTASLQAFLPVVTQEVWFVQGEGAGLDHFAWLKSATANSSNIESFIHREFAKPATDLLRESLYDVPTFVEGLAGGRAPNVAVLLHLSDADWKCPNFVNQVEVAVRAGMQLIIIDPPLLPTDPSEAALSHQLQRMLPAYSLPDDSANGAKRRQTIDRTPMITFVFDHSNLWTLERAGHFSDAGQSSSAIPNGLQIQLDAANALLDEYRRRGLLKGTLSPEVIPGGKSTPRILYNRHVEDQIAVHVAPKISTPMATVTPDPSLANQIIPSMIELRLAAAFPGLNRAGVDLAAAGLKATDVADEIQDGLKDGANFMPHHAVIIFTSHKAPQPASNEIGNSGTGIPIILNSDETDRRECKEAAMGMLRELLLRGSHVAIIGIGIGPVKPNADSIDDGVANYSAHWPVNETKFFTQYSLSPEEYLKDVIATNGQLETCVAANPSAYLLDAAQASKRLLRINPLQPFFVKLDLVSSTVATDAKKTGQSLASQWLPIHSSPRAACIAMLLQHSRVADERMRVSSTAEMKEAVAKPAADFDKTLPVSERWAAPVRQRRITLNPRISAFGVEQSVIAVTLCEAFPVSSGDAMIVSGRLGAGGVTVFAYDPFEVPPSEFGRTGRDAMAYLDPHDVIQSGNRMGLQRITDLATFWGTLQSLNAAAAAVRNVRILDARGSLEFDIELTASLIPQTLQKGVQVAKQNGPSEFSVDATLVGLDPQRGRLVFAISGAGLSTLYASELAAIRARVDAAAGTPLLEDDRQYWGFEGLKIRIDDSITRVACWIPPPRSWSGLSSLESIRTASRITGGTPTVLQGTMHAVQPPKFGSRRWGAIALSLAFLSVASIWGVQRIREWMSAAQIAHQEIEAIRQIDGFGVAELIGSHRSLEPILKVVPTEAEPPQRFTGRGDPRAITNRSIGPMAIGKDVQLQIVPRLAKRNQTVTIVVSVDAAMRLNVRPYGNEPKIRLAAKFAEILTAAAILDGAVVWLQVGGIGPYVEHGEFSGVHTEGEVEEIVLAASRENPSRSPLDDLHIQEGSNVYWISDFCEETQSDNWFQWVDRHRMDAGRVIAVHCSSQLEVMRTGFAVLSSGRQLSIHSRIGLTAWDLRDRLDRQLQAFREKCATDDIPLIEISPEVCTSANAIADLFASAGDV